MARATGGTSLDVLTGVIDDIRAGPSARTSGSKLATARPAAALPALLPVGQVAESPSHRVIESPRWPRWTRTGGLDGAPP